MPAGSDKSGCLLAEDRARIAEKGKLDALSVVDEQDSQIPSNMPIPQ